MRFRIFWIYLLLINFSSQSNAQVLSASDKLYYEAIQYYDLGYDARAMRTLRKGIRQFPNSPKFYREMGDIFFDKNIFEKAMPNYIEALSLYELDSKIKKDDFAELHLLLTISYYQIGLKEYFSNELCLRIFYHANEYLQFFPEQSKEYQNLIVILKDVLKKEEKGVTNIHHSLNLPQDHINNENKIKAKENMAL